MQDHAKYPYSSIFFQYMLVSAMLLLLSGCNEDSDKGAFLSQPLQRQAVSIMKIAAPRSDSKMIGLQIEGVALDSQGNPTGETISPINLSSPTFPLSLELPLYVPPCHYQISMTAILSRDAPRTTTTVIDACQNTSGVIMVDTFEEMRLAAEPNPITAPDSAMAGETLIVNCGPLSGVSAPDADRYPLRAILQEENGQSVAGPIGEQHSIMGTFPDPFPADGLQDRRVFTCRVEDGRSTPQIYTKTVMRNAMPAPTPMPVLGVTPTVANTPPAGATPTPPAGATPTPTPPAGATPTPTPTPPAGTTPTPTPTPTPLGCVTVAGRPSCWYLAPPLTTCNTVCAAIVQTCNETDLDWAYPSDANCGVVLNALGVASGTITLRAGDQSGCGFNAGSGRFRGIDAACSIAASGAADQKVCPCQ